MTGLYDHYFDGRVNAPEQTHRLAEPHCPTRMGAANEKASISAGFSLSGGRSRNDHWLRASASILELAAVSRMNQHTTRVQAITAVAYQ